MNVKRWWRLKLLCRDDAKGPVTFLCGMNGYLVSSMGQKVCWYKLHFMNVSHWEP